MENNKQKIYYSIFALLLTCFSNCKSLNTKHNYKFYTSSNDIGLIVIKDTSIYPILDSSIFYAKQCIFHRNENPYYFRIIITSLHNQSPIIALNASLQNMSFFLNNTYGAFYYKNNLFLITMNKDDRIFNRYFKQINEPIRIDSNKYKYVEYLENVGSDLPLDIISSLTWEYKKRKLIFKEMSLCKEPSIWKPDTTRVIGEIEHKKSIFKKMRYLIFKN